MKRRNEEEEEQPFYGHIIGYCDSGPIYRTMRFSYCHSAYCNTGELGASRGKRTPTRFGWRIIDACPKSPGIDASKLIRHLGGLSNYENYQQCLTELVETGYLLLKDGKYTRP